MFEKLESLESKYNELMEALSTPEVIADQSKYQKFAKAHAELTDVVNTFREYKIAVKGLEDSRMMLSEEHDSDMEEMIREEIQDLEKRKEELAQYIRVLLLPRDPNDDKKRHYGNSCWHRRRRGGAVCIRPFPDVLPLRRKPGVAH